MSEQHGWARRNWKLLANIITIAALAGLCFFIREDLVETFHNLGKANVWLLLLMIPVAYLNYHAQAKLYQGLFEIVGNKLSYKQLLKASLELNFVNHVFPSGGVTGFSYFSLRMREGEQLTAAKATLVHTIKLVLLFLSFELVLLFGVLSLALMGRASNLVILVATAIATLLLVATGLFIWLVGKQSRINNFFTAITQGLNKIIHIVRPNYPETINISQAKAVFDDFHHNYRSIKDNLGKLKNPFWYALLANVAEVMLIYVVYMAFGEFVNIGAVILAYAIANFAGLVSVLPGGVGIYEALMTAVLAAMGIPPSVSLPVTITYRVLSTLIQVPPGYFLYWQALRNSKVMPPPEIKSG